MGRGGRVATASLRSAFSRLDHHQLVLPRLVYAAKRRGFPVLLRVEARDALLEARELDDDEAVESIGAFEDLVAPAAREHLRAVLREDRGHAVRVLPVLHGIVDFRPGYPIRRHGLSLREELEDFAGVTDHRIRAPGVRIAAFAVIAPAGGDEVHSRGARVLRIAQVVADVYAIRRPLR